MERPPDLLQVWIEDHIGRFEIVSHFAHSHAYSNLWRLRAGSDHVWLKMHAHARKWAGEVHALTHWATSLSPKLIAWRDEPRAMLLAETPGVHAESIEYSPEAEDRLWSEAGAWLREFHQRTNAWLGDVKPDGSPWDESPIDLESFLRNRMEPRLFKGRDSGLLTAAEFDFAEGAFREGLPAFAGAGAYSIHRDFTPRNWLSEPNGRLTAVIDFEHARWDVRAADLNRPWDWDFARNPRLIDAFYEAYGRPNAVFAAQIQLQRLINAVTGIVWAVEVGDLPFAETNKRSLSRMMKTTLTP